MKVKWPALCNRSRLASLPIRSRSNYRVGSNRLSFGDRICPTSRVSRSYPSCSIARGLTCFCLSRRPVQSLRSRTPEDPITPLAIVAPFPYGVLRFATVLHCHRTWDGSTGRNFDLRVYTGSGAKWGGGNRGKGEENGY